MDRRDRPVWRGCVALVWVLVDPWPLHQLGGWRAQRLGRRRRGLPGLSEGDGRQMVWRGVQHQISIHLWIMIISNIKYDPLKEKKTRCTHCDINGHNLIQCEHQDRVSVSVVQQHHSLFPTTLTSIAMGTSVTTNHITSVTTNHSTSVTTNHRHRTYPTTVTSMFLKVHTHDHTWSCNLVQNRVDSSQYWRTGSHHTVELALFTIAVLDRVV
jgi:hypothetical protein